MKKITAIFILLYVVSFTAYSKTWIIASSSLEVKFNDQTNMLTVTDKRIQKAWQQTIAGEIFTVKNTSQRGNTLQVDFTGKNTFTAIFTLTSLSALEISLSADTKMPMNELSFPAAFKTPDKDHYLLYTDGGGFLLPADDTDYPLGNGRTFFCGGGTSMAWMGMTDTQFESGYMAILETPFDAALRTKRENGLVTFSPVWLSSKDQFAYDRKVTYHFFDKGGYVAQCKKYRDHIWKKNNVITLKQNEQKTPAIAKMIGGVHIYVWDNAREASFAAELKQSGIDKALILWNPNHTPYPKMGYDTQLKELGYATGTYELFTDLKLRDTVFRETDEKGPLRFALTSYPGKFNELAIRNKDGKTVSNQFGHTSNPIAIRPEMVKRIERELKEFKHESYFLDVYQANGLFEDYSTKNPLTRQQFAEEVIKNHKLLADKYGQFMGGEWGADYLGSGAVYNHGMMTLQRTWFGSDIQKKGTIYYYGDWKNNSRPTQMLGTRVAPDKYLRYSINEYTRVPLYDLVYHDAVVSSWRWEDGNHHNPEIWWKKDLFNILYGNAPLWSIDRNVWDAYKNTFIESYKNICPWLQKIGYDEMVSHRFVTADHKVQETVFSSGKKAVVNFGDTVYTFQGKPIKPKGFLLL
ncbi:glycoside hydrolase [Pedobacter jamesrossensis]|uniref:Glycoside hydrolase n=1 Tax=Pedobacter jamesrossensis TaxID=1908238 RepID=A0ABV8NQ14_9SPHI